MTTFEKYLIDNGYDMHTYDLKNRTFVKAKNHFISTMTNISHSYIHKDDKEHSKYIVFGLREKGKPPTLIYPRPKIRVKKFIDTDNGKLQVVIDQKNDDPMNICLSKETPETILKAMYDDSIIFKYDLTK